MEKIWNKKMIVPFAFADGTIPQWGHHARSSLIDRYLVRDNRRNSGKDIRLPFPVRTERRENRRRSEQVPR